MLQLSALSGVDRMPYRLAAVSTACCLLCVFVLGSGVQLPRVYVSRVYVSRTSVSRVYVSRVYVFRVYVSRV